MKPPDPSRSIPFLVNRTAYLVHRLLTLTVKANGIDLTPEEFHVLVFLMHHEGLQVSELAGVLVRDRTTTTRLIDSLVHRGYAKRAKDPKDKRANRVFVTDEGRKAFMTIAPMGMKLEHALTGSIPTEEMILAASVMMRIQAACVREITALGEDAGASGTTGVDFHGL